MDKTNNKVDDQLTIHVKLIDNFLVQLGRERDWGVKGGALSESKCRIRHRVM